MIKKFNERVKDYSIHGEAIIKKIEANLDKLDVNSHQLPVNFLMYISYEEFKLTDGKILDYLRKRYAENGWTLSVGLDYFNDQRDGDAYWLNISLNKGKLK